MPSDLSLQPDYVYEEDIQYKTLVSSFENGYEQRRQKWSSPLHRFLLTYKNRSLVDMRTIKTLFTTKAGMAGSFTWTNPNDSTEYTVRFEADSLKIMNKAYGIYDFEFNLVEVKA